MTKTFVRGEKYTHQEYIDLSISEMRKSKSEHSLKTDPKVGAVLVTPDGKFFDKAHRGELRKGDHAEFTVFERKNPQTDLSGYVLYTTLEPCVKRNPPKKGCAFRTINSRLSKVVVGHIDPDPTVARKGIRLLESENIQVEYYDREYEKIIADLNSDFFKEARQRAIDVNKQEINDVLNPIEEELIEFQLDDFSDQAQTEMIEKMGLAYKMGSPGYITFLRKMKLIKIADESKIAHPTGLGLLLLGKEPQIHFPQAKVKFTIRRLNQDPIFKDFVGPLVLLPNKIEEYLDIIFPKGFSRTRFKRTEDKEVSYTAILEVIMNAIVHRNYELEGVKIQVNIDEEKILVSSPGIPLSPIEKLNSFSAPSVSMNPKIAHIFYEMKFIEERGFGMEALNRLNLFYGLPKPTFELDGEILMTTIYRKRDEALERKITKLKGLELLLEHKRISSPKYSELANVSERTARNHLSQLEKAGLVEVLGKGKNTIYVLK